MRRSITCVVACALLGGVALEAVAQQRPQTLVNQRKSVMALQGKYFGPVLAMVQGRSPYDAATVQRNADFLSVLSQMPWDDFQSSTVGVANVRAKEEIYKDAAKFKAAIDAFQTDVKALAAAARGGDQAAVGTAARNVARNCNSCHENFSTFEFRFRLP